MEFLVCIFFILITKIIESKRALLNITGWPLRDLTAAGRAFGHMIIYPYNENRIE